MFLHFPLKILLLPFDTPFMKRMYNRITTLSDNLLSSDFLSRFHPTPDACGSAFGERILTDRLRLEARVLSLTTGRYAGIILYLCPTFTTDFTGTSFLQFLPNTAFLVHDIQCDEIHV